MPKSNNQKQEKILLEQITETLQKQKLTNQMQKELALLLLLRSILEEKKNYRNTQKIKIVDLAISTLLQHQELDEKNKFFIQKIRKKLDYESVEPNALIAILRGHGGAYNRLISGLTWYFLLFVFLPSLFAGVIFFGGQFSENWKKGITDAQRVKGLIEEVNNQENKLKNANEISSILRGTLDEVNLELDLLVSENKVSQAESNPVNNVVIQRIERINNDIKQKLESTNKKLIEQIKQDKLNINKQPEQTVTEKISIDDLFKKWFIEQDIFFISLAISMGALGSITSIVVRSQKFIEKSQDEEQDLFFVGFLRPFVGMSFAIFTVVLIESGIFLSLSGITDNSTKVENRPRTSRQIYYYMALAFIAGFSERFVQDLVSKVDNFNDESQNLEDDSSRQEENDESQKLEDNSSRKQEIEEQEISKEQERRLKFDEDS